MDIYRGLESLSDVPEGPSVVTIGSFDGIHLGHQAILRATCEHSAQLGARSIAITFDRHPREVIHGTAPALITSVDKRLELLEVAGLDATVVLHFDQQLASLTADEFLDDIVRGKLGAIQLVVGHDAGFGKGRQGNEAFLKDREAKGDIGLHVISAVTLADQGEVSSTAIRTALHEGRIADATQLLGHPFWIRGTVVEGAKRGRELGFPTANIDPDHTLDLATGVYAVRVELDGTPYWGLANVGRRPTFESDDAIHYEIHILEYDGDIYGELVDIEFVEKLRDEMKFDGPDALIAQIEKDRDRLINDIAARNA